MMQKSQILSLNGLNDSPTITPNKNYIFYSMASQHSKLQGKYNERTIRVSNLSQGNQS